MKTKTVNYALALLGFVPLAVWCYVYLDFDLWYDEVYSLEHFALVDFSTTLFYYPAPNNHIFFNLTSQLISRIFGYRDIFSAADHVYVFRFFQLLISVLTAYFSMRIITRFFKVKSSFLIYIILFTTIPYMNFSLQLRGYNLSSLFLVMLLYYTWSYITDKKQWQLLIILLTSLLLLYTIPSNLYALVAFWGIILLSWFYLYRKGDTKSKYYLKPLLFISIGVILAFILYLPILHEVIFNKYSNRSSTGVFQSFAILLETVPALLSARYLLLLLIVPGLFVFYKKSDFMEKWRFLALAALFLVPYAIAFVHHKNPFPRVFILLAPIFCIMMTLLLAKFMDNNLLIRNRRILQILVTGYCVFVFVKEIDKNNSIIETDMVDRNIESQNLYRNFYLADFYRQDSTMKYLSTIYNGFPVVKLHQRDQPSTDMYLNKYHVPFSEVDTVLDLTNEIKERGRLYLLTSYKNKTLEELKTLDGIQTTVLTKPYSFTNIILVEPKRY